MTTIALAPAAAPINLSDQTLRNNPHPTYARLRETMPVAPAVAPFFGRAWLVTRYEDVSSILRDPRYSSDMRNNGREEPAIVDLLMPRVLKSMRTSMVTTDDPDHARLRGLVHQAFTPKRVNQLRGRVEEVSVRLLEEMAHKAARGGRVDLISDYALPLPLTIISDMMGVSEADRHYFHKLTAHFLEGSSSGMLEIVRQLPNGHRLMRFFEKLIGERRANPGDDLLSALIVAEQDGDRLNEQELVSMIFLLLLAGHETTVNLIGNGTLALLENRDQFDLLYDQPDLIESAVEELLRYSSPVEYDNARFLKEDIELHGVLMPRGSTVLAALASANRDEAVFDAPDRLDITRSPNKHVAFGLGIHYCLGAPLARLEGQTAIRALVLRYPGLKLAVPASDVRWRNAVAVRGLRELPVTLG